MIESFNQFAETWAGLFLFASVQSSFYIVMILGVLFLFREKNVKILRIVALFGLLKLLIPPLFSSSLIQNLNIPLLPTFNLGTTITDTHLINSGVDLSLQSKLFLLWLTGVVFIVIYSVQSTSRLRTNFIRLTSIDTSDYISDPIPHHICFYKSDQHHYPIVFGLIQIKIILPEDWGNWSDYQKRIVILHELNHVRQGDPWINILKLIVFSIHFFNPLVWILLKRINELTELTCDDLTIVATKSSDVEYSKQLLHFSEWYSNLNRTLPPTLTFTESYKTLKKRLSYHLTKKEDIIMKDINYMIRLVILICIISMIPFLGQCSKEQPHSTTSESELSEKPESGSQNVSSYSYEDVTVKPQLLHKESPDYPDEARKNGIMGLVVVTVTIDEKGDVIRAIIVSSENPVLNNVSLEAAKKCKFTPAEIDGQAVRVNMNIPYRFALK